MRKSLTVLNYLKDDIGLTTFNHEFKKDLGRKLMMVICLFPNNY